MLPTSRVHSSGDTKELGAFLCLLSAHRQEKGKDEPARKVREDSGAPVPKNLRIHTGAWRDWRGGLARWLPVLSLSPRCAFSVCKTWGRGGVVVKTNFLKKILKSIMLQCDKAGGGHIGIHYGIRLS